MTRRLIAVLAVVGASTALLAAPAAATPPPPQPPQLPSAYVQTANYNNGCSDWYLRSSFPMSTANPKWVFTCSNTFDDGYYVYYAQDYYYWNAVLQKVILFEQVVWDDYGWYSDCIFGSACQA